VPCPMTGLSTELVPPRQPTVTNVLPCGGKYRRPAAKHKLPPWPPVAPGSPDSSRSTMASSRSGQSSESLLALCRPNRTNVDETDWWSPEQLQEASPHGYALDELRRYVADWAAAPQDEFWCRKSGKAVLSVVVCKGQDGRLTAYRGRNAEVSLPAGSLCAERAAIGQAASNFHRASDIVAVAIVDPDNKINPLWPCEVCQSWLAKLRSQSPEIAIIAVESLACDRFLIKVNGTMFPPPRLPLPTHSLSGSSWQDHVILAEGMAEMPWEAQELIYVDGSWTFLHSAQQNILKVARTLGTHLLVGVHSEEVLKQNCQDPIFECFETRMERVLHNRHVSSVLKDAPWVVTAELIASFGVNRVITGSVDKLQDMGKVEQSSDPYGEARRLGILEVVPSLNETTERSTYEAHVARALKDVPSVDAEKPTSPSARYPMKQLRPRKSD